MATNLVPFMVALVGIATLAALGDLTGATGAAVTIVGSLMGLTPGLSLVTRHRPVFRLALAYQGITFGMKSWVGGLAQMANVRLDQFLMITVVAPRILGLYAVATTISGASGLVGAGLAPPLMARVARGESLMMAQAVRIMIAATILIGTLLALVTPVLLSVLFGPQFRDAYPMALILFVGQIPLVGASVLSSALQAHGAPMIPTVGEGMALIVTVVGLVALLGPLGGIGAAIVSLAAYSASFSFQVVMAHRLIEVPLSRFLLPTREDLVLVWQRVASTFDRWRVA
jgi:O-antigen/teichoic acid export membrane protein